MPSLESETKQTSKVRMDQPSSPGTNPVEMRNYIEELVKFILHSLLDGTLEYDIGLSRQFSAPLSSITIQPTPMSLALALYGITTFGSLEGSSNCDKLASFCQGSDLKQKEEWFDSVHKNGTELVEILKSINFELHVQEPFFTQLQDGLKTIEGRCAVGDYNGITSGALILFNKCLVLEVQDVHHYASFIEMLEVENLAKVLPGVKTIDEGIQVYRKFYSQEKEMSNGVLAICVAKVAAQPYISLARILSGLRYEGVLSLLNQEHIVGSIP